MSDIESVLLVVKEVRLPGGGRRDAVLLSGVAASSSPAGIQNGASK